MKRAVIAASLLAGTLSVLTACDTVKTTYNSWFGAPSPSVKPADLVPFRSLVNVRVDALQPLNWRRTFEVLQRNNYQDRITLKTEPAKSDEAMRELMHYIGEL